MIPPSIYFVLRYHDRYGFVNYIDAQRSDHRSAELWFGGLSGWALIH